MKIGIANDHRGFKLKEYLKENIKKYEIVDYGTDSEESIDYPDYAYKLAKAVVNNQVDCGIAICGSGIGMSIACNKVKGIRCARVVTLEDAKVTRIDNDANIIALSGSINPEYALKVIETFITTPASLDERHVRRRNKISEIEAKEG